ncbi:MAG: hypothetical protein AABZ33_03945 [Chloroflexota bacterium]
MRPEYRIEFPREFADVEWEVEAKGFLPIKVHTPAAEYRVDVYDRTRLRQDLDLRLAGEPSVPFANLIVVERVTRDHIESAVEHLADRDFIDLARG